MISDVTRARGLGAVFVVAGVITSMWSPTAAAQNTSRDVAVNAWPADLVDLREPPDEPRSGRVAMKDGSVRTYVTIRNEPDLRKLVSLLPRARGIVVAQVYGEIVLREREMDARGRDRVKGLYIPECEIDLAIVGMTPDAGITFNMTFDGDWRGWGHGARQADNGLSFRGRLLMLSNLTFRNYNWLGGAVRSDASHSTWLYQCRLANIGSITFPTSKPAGEVTSSTDTLYTGAAVGGTSPEYHLDACTFADVGRGNHWNHSVYPSGVSTLEITNSAFTRCGNPLALGYCDRIVIRGCTFDNEGEVSAELIRKRVFTHGHLIFFDPESEVVFADNVVRGTYDDVIHQGEGALNPAHHRFARNDYRGVTLTRPGHFWFIMGKGLRPWQAWRAAGFGANSQPPAERPGRR